MARSRNIKPGFFTNEKLGELPPVTRLLFIGLWTIADKQGRLEERPKKLKITCLPYDQVNIESCLDELCRAGFIHRYTDAERNLIEIVNWKRHQTPHHKEIESELPGYQEVIHACVKHKSSITTKASISPPDSLNLIPDSLLLIPDSLIPDRKDTADKPPRSPRFIKPSLKEIRSYCDEIESHVNPATFFNHYETVGWKVGRNQMKDWRAAVRGWTTRDRNQ